jgi:hypothetical protein
MELLTLIILLFVMFLLWYQTGQLSKICQQQAGLIDALAGLILVVKDAGREITQATQQLERLKQIERNTGTLRATPRRCKRQFARLIGNSKILA